MLILGGAVDFARYTRYKTELANAVDAAALALAKQGDGYTEAQATAFVEDYVTAMNVGDGKLTVQGFDVDITDDGYIVTADGSMETTFLPLGGLTGSDGGIMTMDLNILSEVVTASNRVELALVFDNTGSMTTYAGSNPCGTGTDRMSGLKCAAETLLDTLMTDEFAGTDFIKVALVPFEGAVNIKNSALDYSWLDWQDTPQAKFNAANFDPITETTCVSSLFDRLPSFAGLLPSLPSLPSFAGLGAIGTLAASFTGNGLLAWHWGGDGGGGCTTVTTTTDVSHKWLFDKLNAADSNVEWAGCVEMRAEPYDLLDTTPDASDPDTLFVPFIWPDEPDSVNNEGYSYYNNYLSDVTSSDGWNAIKYSKKYQSPTWQSGKKDTSFPYESGPNRGCPRPILPLTNDKSTVETAIGQMVAYGAMGTYIPTGLVWGWHVLTANAPFTEGVGSGDADYDVTVKAIVLLTDGDNDVFPQYNRVKSLYSGYNYSGTTVDGDYRLGNDSSESTAEAALDSKVSELCTNIKNAGVRLYTVTFGAPSDAQTLMRNCASIKDGERLYYDAANTDALVDAFTAIGQDLSEIHLAM